MQNQSKFKLRRLAFLGVMTALAAVCSLSFPLGLTIRIGEFIKMSPAFLVVAIVGNMYGFKEAALVSFLSDLIQSLLFGGFSPLISLISVLSGACFGLLLHGTNKIKRIVLSVLITQIIGSLILTTCILCIWYSLPVIPTIYFRIIQTVIMIAVEIPVLILFLRIIDINSRLNRILQ